MKLVAHTKGSDKGQKQGGHLVPLRDVMSRLFDDSLWDPFPHFEAHFPSAEKDSSSPSVDISETKSGYRIELDTPGYTSDEIEVEITGESLFIRGKKQEEKEEKEDRKYLVRQRNEAYFERSFPVPAQVNTEKITCDMKDGKLTIELPKAPSEKAKKIPINIKK